MKRREFTMQALIEEIWVARLVPVNTDVDQRIPSEIKKNIG